MDSADTTRKSIHSIQIKIAFWAGLCLFLTTTIIIAYAARSLHLTAIDLAKQQAIAVAEENAVVINEELETSLSTARTLGQILATVRNTDNAFTLDREQVNTMLEQILLDNTSLIGVYTYWEPDAFDGRDAEYANTPGHDESGRFVPYWSRNNQGIIDLSPLNDYTNPESGQNHLCSQNTRLECITDPYSYAVQGEDMTIISLVVPIIVNGELYGVTGVDIRTDFFQRLTNTVKLYDGTAEIALISNNGTIAAVTNQPQLIGMPATAIHGDFEIDNEIQRIQEGERVVEFDENGDLEVLIPIHFLRIWTPWSVSITVPNEKITSYATFLMWQMIAIGVIFTLAALALIWIVAGQIARPVRRLTTLARSVAEGNLEAHANITSKDELGILGGAFNQMIDKLRHMIEQDRETNDALEAQNAEQKRLLELVSTLETPAIPLLDGLLFAPIVGTLDSRRAQDLTTRLLEEVHTHRIRKVILDITGVLMIDTQVAHALIQTAQALRLLGCEIAITGISAEVATTITHLGIRLDGVQSAHSLQEVLHEHFLKHPDLIGR